MHDNAIFSKKLCCFQKLADGHSSTDLVDEVALSERIGHGREIAETFIRVIFKFPPVARHEISENIAKIDETVNHNSSSGPSPLCAHEHRLGQDQLVGRSSQYWASGASA